MSSIRFPHVRWLGAANLHQDYHHSLLISLLRGLAAVEVAAAHLRAQMFPSLRTLEEPTLWYQALSFFTGFAHQAVVVFFVLSGWLVGGSLLNKLHEPRVMASYAIDRITRLWIVLIPAFFLTLLLGAMSDGVDLGRASYSTENEYSAASFIGNLFGLQDMLVPRYGGNFALWSLANETWYYVLFPLVVVPFVGRTPSARIACALMAIMIAWYLTVQITLYFTIWLLGVGFSRIHIVADRLFRLLLLAVLLAIAVYFRLTGSNDILTPESFNQDLLFSVVFLAFLSTQQFKADRTRPGTRLMQVAGERLAAFSFTLYVIHVPLLLTLRAMVGERLSPHGLGDLGIYTALLILIVFLAYLFHLPFEAQTYRVRGLVKKVVFARNARQLNMATE